MKTSRTVTGILAGLVLVALAGGCASDPKKDPIEKAKRITALTNEANGLLDKFFDGFDAVTVQREIETSDWSPGELDRFHEWLSQAGALYREALDLDKRAREWRFKLAVVLSQQGALHGLSYSFEENRAEGYREKNQTPPPECLESVNKYRGEWRRLLEAGNLEYRFFVNNLMAGAPPRYREPVLTGLMRNYVALEDWRNAADLARLMKNELPGITEAGRARLDEQIARFEEWETRRELDRAERAVAPK